MINGLTRWGDHVVHKGNAKVHVSGEPVIPVIEKTLATAAAEGVGDARQLVQLVARAVANWVFRTHRHQPVTIDA